MGEMSVIITAGGIGKRMGGSVPKQFLELEGKPVILHTMELFYELDKTSQLIITLPTDWLDYWQEMLTRFGCTIPHQIAEGGAERYHSIKNALNLCIGSYVAVHDAVRPLVTAATVKRCYEAVRSHKAVVPVLPVKESIRQVFNDTSRALDRSSFCLVQTPQCFQMDVLREAYDIPFHSGITDDASLVEEAGYPVFLVEGNEENIKITTPTDIIVVEAIMKRKEVKP